MKSVAKTRIGKEDTPILKKKWFESLKNGKINSQNFDWGKYTEGLKVVRELLFEI